MIVSTFKAEDGMRRCKWCEASPALRHYHDFEWGFPVKNDQYLFEKLCLESFQSGLSWRTILDKRDNLRVAFHNFDLNRISQFRSSDVEQLLKNKGIIRHRGKIEAVINNAKRVEEIIRNFGSLAAFLWFYEPQLISKSKPQRVLTSTKSVALSRNLKNMGWKFIGPTTIYSFMQAMGMINDHAAECVINKKVERARKKFQRPYYIRAPLDNSSC